MNNTDLKDMAQEYKQNNNNVVERFSYGKIYIFQLSVDYAR